jgi:hypothetical protein
MKDKTFEIGWILIPPSIAARNDLTSTDKLLLGKINGLTGIKGYCFASNEWLGQQIGLKSHSVSELLTKFEEMKLISRDTVRNDKNEIIERKIYPLYHESDIPMSSERHTPMSSEPQDSNRDTSIETNNGEKEDFKEWKETWSSNRNKTKAPGPGKRPNYNNDTQKFEKKVREVIDATDII